MKKSIVLFTLALSLTALPVKSQINAPKVGISCADAGTCNYTEWFDSTFIPNLSMGSAGGGVGIQTAYIQRERQRVMCIRSAKMTGEKCKTLYQELQPVCSSLTAFFGARLGAKFWEKALGVELDDSVKNAMALGASTIGANVDDAAINCTYLTSQAMNYCEVGAKKMENKC